MTRNKKGQFTSDKMISIKVTKTLQAIADDVAIRVKPIIRDKLEQTLRFEINASRTPATEKGKVIESANQKNKHQQSRLYHRTGQLAEKVYAYIDGDTIKTDVREYTYDNGTTAKEVYDILKFGTTDTPKSDVYAYDNKTKFSKYIPQEPHNFEARTRKHMNTFIEDLVNDIHNHPENYSEKYRNAVKAKFLGLK